MKILILFNCFVLALADDDCGKFHVIYQLNKVILFFSISADIPSFFNGRIIGGSVAPSMIPWQVAVLYSNLTQFCGGTILDSFTVLSAASCNINITHSIRAGSLIKNDGGQVCRSVFSNNW